MVFLCIAAACRDESAWPEPDQFDPDRFTRPDTAKLLNFGAGTHYCLGTALAKIAVEESLRAVLAADPALRLTEDPPTFRGVRCSAAVRRDCSSVPAPRPKRHARCSAPTRSAAAATAASRAALASSSVSVRSAARNRSASVSDLRPSPICGPV